MFKRNNNFNQILKMFLIMIFFTINVFAEIPHSYVTENPTKEVTQTETLKRHKEKAELNLSITKLKSEEAEGINIPEQKKIFFSLDNEKLKIEMEDHIYVSEELQEVPSISTTNGRRKINGILNKENKVLKEGTLEYTVTKTPKVTEIEISYSKVPKEIYIGILDSQYKIKKILKGIIRTENIELFAFSDQLGMLYNRDFDAEHRAGTDDVNHVNLKDIIFESEKKYGKNTFIRKVSGVNKIKTGHTQNRPSWFSVRVYGYNKEGTKVYDSNKVGHYYVSGYADSSWFTFPWNVTLPEHCKIVIQVWGHLGNPYHDNSGWDNTMDAAQVYDVKLDDFIHKADGVSNLVIDANYKFSEYLKFDSCTVEILKPLSALNSVKGIKIASTSGDGLLQLDPTDTLEVNGRKHILSSSNLSEQRLNLDKIVVLYKVENGKLQLKVESYGLKVPSPQSINIKINKTNKEIHDIMEHTLNLTVPYVEKIVGESDIAVSDKYNNNYMTIQGCSLTNPQDVSFVSPITGAEIHQYKGKGIIKFEPGDILEVNGVQTTINSSSGMEEKSANVGGISTNYKAQNGNFQIKINDYKIGQESPQSFNMKLIRNGNEIMNHILHLFVPKIIINNNKMNVKIRDEYKEEYFNIHNLPSNVKGIEFLSGDNKINVYTTVNENERFEEISINGRKITLNKNETLNFNNYTVKTQASRDKLILSLSNYPKKISKPFEMSIKSSYSYLKKKSKSRYNGGHDSYHGSDMGGHGDGNSKYERVYQHAEQNIIFYYVPSKVVGQSTLEVKEYYPTPEYIAFNSCTTPAPAPIELENSLRDVKIIQNSGNGLVNLEQGDILELNGKQYTITAGGNLQEQNDTIGNINFKFKVENGKIRLALKDWGVLEPDRLLTINASREGYPIMEHKMIIKAPRRVEGLSTLTFTEKYPIRDIVKFQGINLTAPNKMGLESPIPTGVVLKSNDGYGIPFMKEGDILEVQCNTMKGIKKYIIDSKNSLKHKTIDLPGTVLSLLVEDGKLRLGLNNWLVNKNTVLNFRIIRGVNEINNTSITLEVPKAPFDVAKNGMLDFGKVIQGSNNRKAETSILIEMHKDISDVKFSLSTTTPELVNSSGATLHAKDLQAGVHKQGNRRHLVRIIGRLDVPAKQELGTYRGSVLLNVKIK